MSLAGPRFSSETAPRPFQYGIRGRGGTIFRTALPSDERQVKADHDLTSPIVPRGDTIPPLGGVSDFSPIAFDSERLSCRCNFPGPPELGAINPDAVHDDRQPTRQRHDRLFHPAVLGDLHRPRLEPGPFR